MQSIDEHIKKDQSEIESAKPRAMQARFVTWRGS